MRWPGCHGPKRYDAGASGSAVLGSVLSALVASALSAGCVVAPYPYGYPATTRVATPAHFDRYLDAALGAAATSACRSRMPTVPTGESREARQAQP